jgi:hypothetical protein
MNGQAVPRAELRQNDPYMTVNGVANYHPTTIYRLVKKDAHWGQFRGWPRLAI